MGFYDAFDPLDDAAAAAAPPPPPGGYNPGAYDKYVTAAITDEVARVQHAANGTRNHTLNNAAFSLYRFTEAGVLPREAVEHELYEAARVAGLPHGEIMTTLASAYRGRLNKPRHLPQLREAQAPPEVTTMPTPAGHTDDNPAGGDPARYFAKDIGLLAATLARDVLAMGPLAAGGDALTWSYNSGVWSPDKHVVRSRVAQLLNERFRRSHASNVEDVIHATSPRINCDPVPEYINFKNGLYAWQADMMYDHTPDVYSTAQLNVDYNPDATCPEFDAFLAAVLPEDMIPTVWELIGYLMYSGNPLHKAVMLVGQGRNGKGTFLRVVNALLGTRNVTSVSLHDLVSTRFSTACLFGKLANIAGDIDGNYLESTATFKAITGQDVISAEHKGRDRFDFTPWAVPVFSANKIPASSDVTTGYLSRWLVVPFPNDFTGREDRRLDERLQTKEELQGIAAKAMPALRRLLDRHDFNLPESGQAARDEFTRRVDQVRTWADECADVDPAHPFMNRTGLYSAYKAWASRDGHKPVKAGEFYDRLASIRGVEQKTIHGSRGFSGIAVTDSAENWSSVHR